MAGCIAIGSLATTVDWFVSFTLHEPIKCSYKCVIEKGFSEEEKRDFPILTSISRRSNRSHISGSRGYDSNRVHILIYRCFFIYLQCLSLFVCVVSICSAFVCVVKLFSSFACVFFYLQCSFFICMCVFFYLHVCFFLFAVRFFIWLCYVNRILQIISSLSFHLPSWYPHTHTDAKQKQTYTFLVGDMMTWVEMDATVHRQGW